MTRNNCYIQIEKKNKTQTIGEQKKIENVDYMEKKVRTLNIYQSNVNLQGMEKQIRRYNYKREGKQWQDLKNEMDKSTSNKGSE